MTRRGTVIRHEILTSESVSEMKQDHKLVWIALLLCVDDWGRTLDKPHKISMQCPALMLNPGLVREAIDAFVESGLIARYTGRLPDDNRTVTILQLTNWEVHQSRLKSRAAAEYPDPEGNYNHTTNPLGLRAIHEKEKESNKEKEKKEKRKLKEKEKVRPVAGRSPCGTPDGNNLVDEYLDFVRELFPDIQNGQAEKQAAVIDEIVRIDGCDFDELSEMLRWAIQDDFWKTNFLSCAPLRKRRDGSGDVMKWQKINASYKKWKDKNTYL